MSIILDLSPAAEARLIQQAEQQGVPVSRYIETLLDNPAPLASPAQKDAYLSRVHRILKQFDELPRLASPQSAEEIIGFDEWGLPAK